MDPIKIYSILAINICTILAVIKHGYNKNIILFKFNDFSTILEYFIYVLYYIFLFYTFSYYSFVLSGSIF